MLKNILSNLIWKFMSLTSLFRSVLIPGIASLFVLLSSGAQAETKAALDLSSKEALNQLIASVPAAKTLSEKAIAVLVFPSITKAGFLVGGQFGDGVMWKNGKPTAYYNTSGASFGLQAGAQTYGYAMFFMKESALKALDKADGFEVGVGPSVVVMDQGMGVSHTTTTLQDDIYAFVFGQKGLMAGVGIQGNKITQINK
jgi:lipid-binding SYLF domain-containing protein